MQKLTFVPSKNVSNLVFYTLITIQAKQEAFMSHISTELDLLIQSLLGNDLNTKFLNILETPEHWNYQYFLALLPLRSEEHTSELQSRPHLVCRLLLEKKKRGVGGR